MKKLSAPPTVATVFDDPSSSYWLRHALTTAFTRDPVDALNDAEVLVKILTNWNNGIYPSPK